MNARGDHPFWFVLAGTSAFALCLATGCPAPADKKQTPDPPVKTSLPEKPAVDSPGAENGPPKLPATAQTTGANSGNPETAATSGAKQDGLDPKLIKKTADGTAGSEAPRPGYAAAKPPEDQRDPFADWPREKPLAAIVISGEQIGYIEPCGCAGIGNQSGGLKRRHTFIQSLQAKGWPLAILDLGGQVKRFGIQTEIKFRTTIQALTKLGYDVVGLGPGDLQMPAEQLLLIAAELPAEKKSLFVSANIRNAFEADGERSISPYRVLEVGGRRIGVTSIVGETYEKRFTNTDIEFMPPAEALAKVVPELAEKADFLVLLSQASPEESAELGKQFPQFDIVVTADDVDVAGLDLKPIDGLKKPRLVEVGQKGMYLVVLGLFDDAEHPIRYAQVKLDSRYKDSPDMQQVLVDYQKVLEAFGLKGLELPIKPHPSGRQFVGHDKCADCHTKAFAIWSKTPHAHATQTLIDLKPARHFDPECLSCHVTGWDSENEKYVPFESGYLDLKKTAHLVSNGCENCHGPGSQHVAAESGAIEADEALLTKLREQMRLPLAVAAATCIKCHDHDNSPDFETKGFEHYWHEVEHRGKD